MENKKNLRNIVLNMLIKTLENGEFSHLVLNQVFAEEAFSAQEKAFVNRLYAGTLEKIFYLDALLDCFSNVKVKKMKPVIRNILRLSVYQLIFMNSVPQHACIDEAVKLTRKRGFSNLTGFVNGVLRKIQREYGNAKVPEYLKKGAPKWFYELLCRQYGSEAADQFLENFQKEDHETTVRFHLSQATEEQIRHSLEEEGCLVHPIEGVSSGYRISGFESLTDLKAFKDGQIIMQDQSSMLAVEIAASGLKKPEIILDVCAAPGGKSLFMADKFPKAKIIARDLTLYKVNLIKENTKRLNIMNVEAQLQDALILDSTMIQTADIVIADLPCSGLGVIKKKPDILYRLKESDLDQLALLQRNILAVVYQYVKPGGILLYSTCTVNKQENTENTNWFLENYDFQLLEEKQILPGIMQEQDGFYIAKLKRYE